MLSLLLVLLSCPVHLVVTHEEGFHLLHLTGIKGRYGEVEEHGRVCRPEIRKDKKCVGGLARVYTLVKSYRANASSDLPVLFVVNGNFFAGSTWTYFTPAEITADLFNVMQPDVVSIGYREFDHGVATLQKLQKLMKMPLIACNVDTTRMKSGFSLPRSFTTHLGKLRVGVVAHLTNYSGSLSNTGDVVFSDELTLVEERVSELHEQGIHFIIVLGSSGIDVDRNIARTVPFIDILVSGMMFSTMLYNGVPIGQHKIVGPHPIIEQNRITGKRVLIVNSGTKSLFLGHIRVVVDKVGRHVASYSGNPIYLENDIPEATEVLQVLDKYRPQVDKMRWGEAGRCTTVLEKRSTCLLRECNFGNLLADALVEYVATEASPGRWTTAPIALVHGSTINAGIDDRHFQGVMLNGDIIAVIPYPGTMSLVTMNGHTLVQVLETAIKAYTPVVSQDSRWFLQVSGVKVVYDMRKPPFSRVVSLKLRCGECPVPKYDPVNTKAYYNVVVPTFMKRPNIGWFRSVLGDRNLPATEIPVTFAHILMWYFKKNQPIHPSISGRIIIIHRKGNSTAARDGITSRWWHLPCVVGLLLRT